MRSNMNVDQRECLKISLMLVAPAMVWLGSLLPSFLILPIVTTLFFGTLIGAHWLDPLDEKNSSFWPVTIFSTFIIVSVWLETAIKALTD